MQLPSYFSYHLHLNKFNFHHIMIGYIVLSCLHTVPSIRDKYASTQPYGFVTCFLLTLCTWLPKVSSKVMPHAYLLFLLHLCLLCSGLVLKIILFRTTPWHFTSPSTALSGKTRIGCGNDSTYRSNERN